MSSLEAQPLIFRPAGATDLDSLFAMAAEAGTGMTNLPADRDVLTQMIDSSEQHFAVPPAEGGARFWFVLVDPTEKVVGTALIAQSIGLDWPFYSFRRNRISNMSQVLGRSVVLETLTLSNDYNGTTEVGGLIVNKGLRGSGAGRLAARSRYLFLATHRDWFGRKVIGELRGFLTADGRSPVWEALGRPFYQMDFADADALCGQKGNQFIAELGPRAPIYADMLPADAREALGRPHHDSVPAYNLLVEEGFRSTGYIDIFDGGPQLEAEIDALAAVRASLRLAVTIDDAPATTKSMLVAAGHGSDFRATRAACAIEGDEVALSSVVAKAMRVSDGDEIFATPF